jgi:hypothetical protein
LATTGVGDLWPWLVGGGSLMIFAASLGRRLARPTTTSANGDE